jgi:hypothetical protein
MSLGRAPDHEDLYRSTRVACEARLPKRSIFRLLARDCHRLFADEVFADLFAQVGRNSVPPRVVAVVMVLQRLHGLSDREAVDRLTRGQKPHCASQIRDAAACPPPPVRPDLETALPGHSTKGRAKDCPPHAQAAWRSPCPGTRSASRRPRLRPAGRLRQPRPPGSPWGGLSPHRRRGLSGRRFRGNAWGGLDVSAETPPAPQARTYPPCQTALGLPPLVGPPVAADLPAPGRLTPPT